jgi:hypothetical protein
MVVNETGDVVADIENEPNGNESGDAVKVNLQKIPNDVSIKKSHLGFVNFDCDLRFTIRFARLVIPSEARNL